MDRDCTTVCESVIDTLIGLGFHIDKEDEDHSDVMAALSQVQMFKPGEMVWEVETVDTGGHVMVDVVKLKDGRILGVTDECVVLYDSKEAMLEGKDGPHLWLSGEDKSTFHVTVTHEYRLPAEDEDDALALASARIYDDLLAGMSGAELKIDREFILQPPAVKVALPEQKLWMGYFEAKDGDNGQEFSEQMAALGHDEEAALVALKEWQEEWYPNDAYEVSGLRVYPTTPEEALRTMSVNWPDAGAPGVTPARGPRVAKGKWVDDQADVSLISEDGGRALIWTKREPRLSYVYDPAEAGHTIEFVTEAEAAKLEQELRADGWYDWPEKEEADPVCGRCLLPYSRHPHDGCAAFDEVNKSEAQTH